MIDDRDLPAEPPVTEDIGLPTPPSPGRLPPPHLPPAPPREDAPSSDEVSPDRSDP
ncbi:hypothetical protein [Methylobacterium sp. J-076]|uniref:hypothetical protein n=1 Tax=Methylobacterium sp. J-076 TaxID=2836655 RepID=UPI001FB8D135|nr:hypothetical protein [Methylobacterium sp. J-076]MCJ2014179.1 hypothetical protein [Methylobacterium sp. J-076]